MGAGIQQRQDSRGPCPEGAPDHGVGQTDIKTNIDGITNLMRISLWEECDLLGKVRPP